MSSVKTNTAAKNPNYWVPEQDEVTDREKFISKAKKDPFVPIGKNFICFVVGKCGNVWK